MTVCVPTFETSSYNEEYTYTEYSRQDSHWVNLHPSVLRDGEDLLSRRLVPSYHRQLFNNLIKLDWIGIRFLEVLLKSWELTPLIVRNHFLIFSLNLFIARLQSFVLMPTLSFTLNSSSPSLAFASADKFRASNHIFFSLGICLEELNELHSLSCLSQIKLPGPLLIRGTAFHTCSSLYLSALSMADRACTRHRACLHSPRGGSSGATVTEGGN